MDEILKFLNDNVNTNNRVQNIRNMIYDSYRHYDVGISNLGGTNITILNYLRYSYIDLLIKNNLATEELRILYDKYLVLENEIGAELLKELYGMNYSKIKISMIQKKLSLVEFYLNKYGVMDIKVDYNKLIKDHMIERESSFPQADSLKKVLKKINEE